MAGVAAALTAFFLYVAGVISQPPKSILFSGLESRDASAVTAKLDTMSVPYEVRGDRLCPEHQPPARARGRARALDSDHRGNRERTRPSGCAGATDLLP